MRTGGATLAALLLVLTSTVLQVSSSGDIYWEGEEDASNEYLEVKQDDSSIFDHLKRLKRFDFDPFNFFSPTEKQAEDVTENTITDDSAGFGKDDDSDNFGSGSPEKPEPEPREKTLRVTFLVFEPYIPEYSNRDSPEFLNISRSLANAVDLLFDSLPGTQRSSLVRIQSLVNDDFWCKVTLDIVTSGYENMNNIEDILRNRIKNNGRLGNTAVSETSFSANVIDPVLDCDESELQCDDYVCLPMSAKCDGRPDCRDGTDEYNCPESTTVSEVRQPPTYDSNDYDSTNETTAIVDENQNGLGNGDDNLNGLGNGYDNLNEVGNGDDNLNEVGNGDDNLNEVGNGDDKDDDDNTIYNRNSDFETNGGDTSYQTTTEGSVYSRGDQGELDSQLTDTSDDNQESTEPDVDQITESPEDITTRRNYITDPLETVCEANHMRCDNTRCVEFSKRCDGINDCDDATDEANCPTDPIKRIKNMIL